MKELRQDFKEMIQMMKSIMSNMQNVPVVSDVQSLIEKSDNIPSSDIETEMESDKLPDIRTVLPQRTRNMKRGLSSEEDVRPAKTKLSSNRQEDKNMPGSSLSSDSGRAKGSSLTPDPGVKEGVKENPRNPVLLLREFILTLPSPHSEYKTI